MHVSKFKHEIYSVWKTGSAFLKILSWWHPIVLWIKKNYVDVENFIVFYSLLNLKLGNCKAYYNKQLKKWQFKFFRLMDLE